MRSMPISIEVIWACSISVQVILLILLLLKGNFQKLQLFATYTILNLCESGFIFVLIVIFGTNNPTFRDWSWIAECVTLFAQALATMESLRLTIKPYPGIWGLGWRALAATSTLVLAIVALTSRGHGPSEVWFEINRGYHLTFATALIACLLLIRYYSIRVPRAYKLILGGFCLNSCIEVLINTFVQVLFHKGFQVHQTAWQSLTMLSFVVALGIWIVALWKPLPAEERQIAPPTDSAYAQLSPEINAHLSQLNEKLMRLWKLEARSH